MVGGGVRGKDVGIAHGTTTQVGPTIKGFPLFMQGYPQAGGMTTGIIVGEGIRGTINEYLINKFNKTGRAGKRTSIGRSNKLGVSKVCNPERGSRDNNLRLSNLNNSNSRDNNFRVSNLNTLSLKEKMKEGMGKIEIRMTKSLKMLLSIISVG
jgi:hypothetical protein